MQNLLKSLTLASLAFAPLANAEVENLAASAVGLSQLPQSQAKVVDVRPLCPEGVTCFANGTVVELEFTLNGCFDRLGPVSYQTRAEAGRLDVFVAAINVHDKRSAAAFCYAAPTARATITMISQYGETHVHFLAAIAAKASQPVLDDSAEVTPMSEKVLLSCRENVDHGAEITFIGNAARDLLRAEYTETSIIDTQLVASMGVCHQLNPERIGADTYEKTATCNDTLWVDGYDVELFEGGFSGIPYVKLYRGPADRQLVKKLYCQYR